ncbi:DNA gyrase, A subunit [Clostridium botulinum E1 str. 'BoNT E Beluga']|nr:DNA gyrase, A subunit [Clostridium botulinum E1 str. 'BoNT E Beluga']
MRTNEEEKIVAIAKILKSDDEDLEENEFESNEEDELVNEDSSLDELVERAEDNSENDTDIE